MSFGANKITRACVDIFFVFPGINEYLSLILIMVAVLAIDILLFVEFL